MTDDEAQGTRLWPTAGAVVAMTRDGFGFGSLLAMAVSEFALWFRAWEEARKAEAEANKRR